MGYFQLFKNRFCSILILFAINIAFTSADEGKCVIYGKCTDKYLCSVDHASKVLDDDAMAALKEYCPELTARYGNSLCCAPEQVSDLAINLGLPRTLLSSCPSCYFNFRQSICDFTCSPYQYRFLSPNSTQVVEDKVAVVSLNYFIGTEHVQSAFESCKNIKLPNEDAEDFPAMDLLCGPWGSADCTAERWYDYMGSTSNGFAPFDILYQYLNVVDEDLPIFPGSDIVGYNNATYSCNEVPPGSTESCQCSDCPGSCASVSVKSHRLWRRN